MNRTVGRIPDPRATPRSTHAALAGASLRRAMARRNAGTIKDAGNSVYTFLLTLPVAHGLRNNFPHHMIAPHQTRTARNPHSRNTSPLRKNPNPLPPPSLNPPSPAARRATRLNPIRKIKTLYRFRPSIPLQNTAHQRRHLLQTFFGVVSKSGSRSTVSFPGADL